MSNKFIFKKSFLKWAGGKSRVLEDLLPVIGEVKGRFIEPFVGSGVVSLNTSAKKFLLADSNRDLIVLYETLKERTQVFINECSKLFIEKNNTLEMFMELRNKFNISRGPFERSMLFIYLNRHCFNGLCRYNSKGGFNVPFGRYSKTHFPEKELFQFAEFLKNCDLEIQDFRITMDNVNKDDVVYCDPPYSPVVDTSFTNYGKTGFNIGHQMNLVKLAEKRVCKTIISNSDTAYTRELYSSADELKSIDVNRFISAKTGSRGKASELIAIYEGVKQ